MHNPFQNVPEGLTVCRQIGPTNGGWSGRGLSVSVLLHVLILLLFMLVGPVPQPPPQERILTVGIVHLEGGAIDGGRAGQMEKKALPISHPSFHATGQRRRVTESLPLPPVAPQDFDGQLRTALATIRSQGHGEGRDISNRGTAGKGRQGGYSVKDFIRAQIQRHWIYDSAALGKAPWVISIHVVLDPDGTVASATIVPDPRYQADEAYMDFARSARNATLISSPLDLPLGTPADMRDMVLEFDPRTAMR